MPVTTRLQKNKSNSNPSIEQQIIDHLARKPKPEDFMDKGADGDIHWCPSWNTCCENSYHYDLYKLRLEEWDLHYGALILMSMKDNQKYTTPQQPIKKCNEQKCKGKHERDKKKYPVCVYNSNMKKTNRRLNFDSVSNTLQLRSRTITKN